MVSNTGYVLSGGDPFTKNASHTISVPLYSDLAGMVMVLTTLPLSLIELITMSVNCPADEPFTTQRINASVDS